MDQIAGWYGLSTRRRDWQGELLTAIGEIHSSPLIGLDLFSKMVREVYAAQSVGRGHWPQLRIVNGLLAEGRDDFMVSD